MLVTSKPVFGEEEKAAVLRIFNEDQMLVNGKDVEELEKEFATFIGTKYAIAVDSGTHALEIAIEALGIQGKIVTTPITFAATAGSIVRAGCEPVFCDINPYTYNINIVALQRILKNDNGIKGIMPVHFAGLPCDMKAINHLSQKYSIPVIEDSCQAHGASILGEMAGSIGEAGCFSLYATKNMTCGGNGGIITTDDEDIRNLSISYREHGRSLREGANHPKRIGHNARMSTLLAAIARVQLHKLNDFNRKRNEVAELYDTELKQLSNKFFKTPVSRAGRVYHLYVVCSSARDKLNNVYRRNNIFCGIHYPKALHETVAFSKYAPPQRLMAAENYAKQCLSLPLHPEIKDENVFRVCEYIKKHYAVGL